VSKKVLVLFDLNERTPVDYDWGAELKDEAFETERDVCRALERLGWEARPLALFDDLRPLLEVLEKEKPDLLFNLSEAFHADRRHEAHLVGLLEMLRVPYTGADPTALMLCKDKALAKRILFWGRIKTPRFVVSPRSRPLKRLTKLAFPVFVKPVGSEGSEGIAKGALATDEKSAVERAAFVHESQKSDALIEEYVQGREIYAGVLGRERLQVLPLVELTVGGSPVGEPDLPKDAPRFFTYKAKWDAAYRKKWRIQSGPPKELDEKIAAQIAETARKACKALRITGYGRIDCRVTDAGEVYVIEANPNPGLAQSDEFAKAAARADIGYDALIGRIVQFAER
jgi:D-alanine-D-alanine ligase